MIEWIEGFDHYGTDYTLMLQGGNQAYADVNPGLGGGIKSTNPRTGPYHFRIGTGTNNSGIRRVFPSGDTVMPGVGYAFYMPTLPSDSNSVEMVGFRDINNATQFSVSLTSDGRLQLRGVGGVLETSDICVFARGYQHFEIRGVVDDTDGGAEIRINGVTRLNKFGVNTKLVPATGNVSQMHIGNRGIAVVGYPSFIDLDDLTGVTSTPSAPTDFLGDKKVYRRLPISDTAQADFEPSVGTTSYPMVANVPPNDDTLFLSAPTAPAQTIMGLEALPDNVVSISAQMVVYRAIKTDAGNSKMRGSLVQGSDVAEGSEQAITQAYGYYGDVFEDDPSTDALWTVSGANSATLSIERTE